MQDYLKARLLINYYNWTYYVDYICGHLANRLEKLERLAHL